MPISEQLTAQLDKLTLYEPGPYPVISLYLNLQPGPQGRDQTATFVRDALGARINTYPALGPERASLEKDTELIRAYLDSVDPASNGLALYASSGAGLFEAIQLAAPVPQHAIYVSDQPHLYPLALLLDQYPRDAVLVADTQSARLIVIAAHAVEHVETVEGAKTRRSKMGGWSQMRFQRRVDGFRAQHAKEVVELLAATVRSEHIRWIIIGGDEVIRPLLEEHMPKDIAEKVIDVIPLDIRAPERMVLERALAIAQRQDEQTDRERVAALLDAYRSGGLGTVGVDSVRQALELGQVDELVITARPDAIDVAESSAPQPAAAERSAAERTADELIAAARRTSASLRFIEDTSLLEPYGGVGAFLRFRL